MQVTCSLYYVCSSGHGMCCKPLQVWLFARPKWVNQLALQCTPALTSQKIEVRPYTGWTNLNHPFTQEETFTDMYRLTSAFVSCTYV